MNQERPDPDELLTSITRDESAKKRGRLKVFLGMSPGVGKTYAMLLEARRDFQNKVDLVIGIVESHKRKETEILLEGLPAIPRRKIAYRGIELEEMDLDAILTRHPQLVLVDEMAHTNAPGSRHPKRYQDIEELLSVGISVYTTLNVQHLESRADVVRQITGAVVHETLPDSLLAQADEIQLVDLTPEDLLERLAEGKVYLGETANVAVQNFFKAENLTALREMALRVAAEHTDSTLRDVMRDRRITGPWKATERLLVGIGPSPTSESLTRWTCRMAAALDCSWLAVYVETEEPLSRENKDRITRHLTLARKLGAEVLTTPGVDIVHTLLQVAREQNVTQIVVGKTHETWSQKFFRRRSFAQRLIRESGLIDIYVVQPEKSSDTPPPSKREPAPFENYFHDWITAGLLSLGLTGLFFYVARFTGYAAIGPMYLLWVVIAGLRFPRSVALLVAACCALLWNFLFIPPRFTFVIGQFHDAAMFFMFFVVVLAIGHLTARIRTRERTEQKRERRTSALYALARETALAAELDIGLQKAVELIETLLQSHAALTLRQRDRTLAKNSHPASTLQLSEKEKSVAEWVFTRGTSAGRFTDTLPNSEALHLPLRARTGIYGVASIQPTNRKTFEMGERDLLEALVDLIAATLEKEHFIEAFKRAEVLEASEQLRRALLDSVSHELKTPLAALQTGFETLLPKIPTSEASEEIRAALRRLRRVIDNLLDMTRIQAGAIRPNLEWTDVEDMMTAAQELAGDALARHRIVVDINNPLPLVKIDQALIEQALTNLLVNAATWSPGGTTIAMQARYENGALFLSVLDEGPGLGTDTKKVFEKFYRAPGAPTGGAGLGLSIVEGFIKAHHGSVEAENREPRGACFTLRLPAEALSADTTEVLP